MSKRKQSKSIERDVFINPPEQFREDDIAWQLRTCAYGFNDVSCTWYLRVCDHLIKVQAKPLPYDPVLFYWQCKNQLNGLLSTHMDDVNWRGTNSFQNIHPFKKMFKIDKESCSMFKYLGLFTTAKRELQNN